MKPQTPTEYRNENRNKRIDAINRLKKVENSSTLTKVTSKTIDAFEIYHKSLDNMGIDLLALENGKSHHDNALTQINAELEMIKSQTDKYLFERKTVCAAIAYGAVKTVLSSILVNLPLQVAAGVVIYCALNKIAEPLANIFSLAMTKMMSFATTCFTACKSFVIESFTAMVSFAHTYGEKFIQFVATSGHTMFNWVRDHGHTLINLLKDCLVFVLKNALLLSQKIWHFVKWALPALALIIGCIYTLKSDFSAHIQTQIDLLKQNLVANTFAQYGLYTFGVLFAVGFIDAARNKFLELWNSNAQKLVSS